MGAIYTDFRPPFPPPDWLQANSREGFIAAIYRDISTFAPWKYEIFYIHESGMVEEVYFHVGFTRWGCRREARRVIRKAIKSHYVPSGAAHNFVDMHRVPTTQTPDPKAWVS